MTATAEFTVIPESRVDGGSVRFFPVITGATSPFVIYTWDFGDGNTSTDPSPTNIYSGASTYTFNVSFHAHDAYGTSSSVATGTVPIVISNDVGATPTSGLFQSVSIFIYNDTNSILVNRTPTTFCTLYLLNPVIKDIIDTSAITTFSILVPRDATAIERSLIVEGSYIIALQGQTIVFSGVIKRAIQDLQGGFSLTTPLQKLDFECDSDLMRLSKLNVDPSVMVSYGNTIIDTPGNIARTILTPATGGWDWRGTIFCNDPVINYQLNPSTKVDQIPSQYEQLISLQSLNNYDLRTRLDYEQIVPDHFNLSNLLTVDGASWTDNELIGYYLFFKNTVTGCKTYGKITDNDATTITATMYGDVSATPAWFIIAKNPKVDFAPNLSTISDVATFDVNSTVFGYSDNDDKRKLYTKVIAKGKDMNGKNISVSLAGIRAYDYDKQFYNGCTFINKKSEGYIYNNTYITAVDTVTVYPRILDRHWQPTSAVYPTEIVFVGESGGFPVGARVTFATDGTTLPTAITAGVAYFVVESDIVYCKVATVQGGTPLDVYTGCIGNNLIKLDFGAFTIENLQFSNGDPVKFSGDVEPGGITFGVQYTVRDVSGLIGGHGIFRLDTYYPTSTGTGVYIFAARNLINALEGTSGTSQITLYGWDYNIATTDTITLLKENTSVPIVLLDNGTEIADSSGTHLTRFTFTQPSPPLYSDFGNRGYLLNSRMWVDDKTPYTSGTVDMMVGEELLPITSSGTTSTGNYFGCNTLLRIPSDTNKVYPHGVGALINPNTYSEATPEEFSVVADYGLYINTTTVETNTTYGELDAYATQLLLGFGAFYKMATCWMPIQYARIKRAGVNAISPNLNTMPRLGDMIGVVETIGATPVDYQIVAMTVKYDEGRIEFQLGDYEKNIFKSLQNKTSGLNQTLT